MPTIDDAMDEAEQIYGNSQPQVNPYTLQQQPMQMMGAPDGWALRKLGPLPVWAWALIAAAGGGAAYWYFTRKPLEKNDGDEEEKDDSSSSDREETKSSWGPSRSRVAEKIEKHLKANGKLSNVTVYPDADEAKKFVRTPSPLVTIKPKSGGFEADDQLGKLLKREGLTATKHEDGSVGLYPADKTKRGREWEKYIDALRDEGQTV